MNEFGINPVTTSNVAGSVPYSTFLQRLAQDCTVQQDYHTGARIVEKEVANSYVTWLQAKAKEIGVPTLKSLPINLCRMVFYGSSIGEREINLERKVYEGGARTPNVTARAALSLVQGAALYTGRFVDKLDFTYLVNSKIICITGGNHRLLSYKLLGIADLPLENLPNYSIILYEDVPDEQLNQALLCFESLEPAYDPRQTKTVVHNNEEAIIQLATTYGAYANGGAFNDLYLFVKEKLATPAGKAQYEDSTSIVALLERYAKDYKDAGINCYSGNNGNGLLDKIFSKIFS